MRNITKTYTSFSRSASSRVYWRMDQERTWSTFLPVKAQKRSNRPDRRRDPPDFFPATAVVQAGLRDHVRPSVHFDRALPWAKLLNPLRRSGQTARHKKHFRNRHPAVPHQKEIPFAIAPCLSCTSTKSLRCDEQTVADHTEHTRTHYQSGGRQAQENQAKENKEPHQSRKKHEQPQWYRCQPQRFEFSLETHRPFPAPSAWTFLTFSSITSRQQARGSLLSGTRFVLNMAAHSSDKCGPLVLRAFTRGSDQPAAKLLSASIFTEQMPASHKPHNVLFHFHTNLDLHVGRTVFFILFSFNKTWSCLAH